MKLIQKSPFLMMLYSSVAICALAKTNFTDLKLGNTFIESVLKPFSPLHFPPFIWTILLQIFRQALSTYHKQPDTVVPAFWIEFDRKTSDSNSSQFYLPFELCDLPTAIWMILHYANERVSHHDWYRALLEDFIFIQSRYEHVRKHDEKSNILIPKHRSRAIFHKGFYCGYGQSHNTVWQWQLHTCPGTVQM